MPIIAELGITHFRNMDSVSLYPSPHINLIHGSNGSGKTSILEAISVLAHGRSFRTHKYRRLIKDSAGEFTVFGRINPDCQMDGDSTAIGVRRAINGDCQFRMDGRNVQTSGELAQRLPLQVIDAHSFQLLEGSAKIRRQFFDWLVFHVKHEFREVWKSYTRSIKQRNSLLRRDKMSYSELTPWDTEIAKLGAQIQELREDVFRLFLKGFKDQICEWSELGFIESRIVELVYLGGWKAAETKGSLEEQYKAQLRDSFERDRKLGYTSLGSHKSDIRISIDNIPAVEILSRGQQKMLIAALFISEATIYQQVTGKSAVFLLDDMPAELDRQRLAALGSWINRLQSQVFVTGVEANSLISIWPDIESKKVKVFHVKQGTVTNEQVQK